MTNCKQALVEHKAFSKEDSDPSSALIMTKGWDRAFVSKVPQKASYYINSLRVALFFTEKQKMSTLMIVTEIKYTTERLVSERRIFHSEVYLK